MILYNFLMAFEAIVCFLLIGIVLLQRSKGQGAGLSFGGSGAEAVFGAQIGNVLTRATVVLAVLFLVNTTLLTVLRPTTRARSISERLAAEPAPAGEAAALPAPIGADGDLDFEAASLLDTMGDAETSAAAAVEEAAAVTETTPAEPAAESAPAATEAPEAPTP